MNKREFQSYEESSRHFQGAFLAERRKVQDLERLFLRVIHWLRGEDPEFSKLIVELRDQKRGVDE